MEKAHCQICEREIKAGKDIIAHHGYQRPDRGSGWQTESCFGARYQPYELSCDRIPLAIEAIKRHITMKEELIEKMRTNPPDELNDRYAMMYNRKVEPYKKPEGFDPIKNLDSEYYGSSRKYEYEHRRIVDDAKRDITWAKKDQDRLEKRLAAWVPPSK